MARSIRMLFEGVQGRMPVNFNWEPINRNSTVIITAAEFVFFGGIAGAAGRARLNDANVYVTNIGPHDPEPGSGGVEFYLHSDGPSPVNAMVTITVLDDVEDFIGGIL